MNWAALAAIAACCSILATVIGIAYLAGKFTERVDAADSRLDKHDTKFERVDERFVVHEDRATKHEVKIGRLEEWKDGFNAAARVSGTKEVS